MGHVDRWRTAALIGAAALLVAVPAVGGVLFLAVMALSTRVRPAVAWRPALATAAMLGLIGLAGAVSVPGFLLTVGLAAIAPLLCLWSAMARPDDASIIAGGFVIGIGANLVVALVTAQGVPISGLSFHPNVLGALTALAVPSVAALAMGRQHGTRWAWSMVLAILGVVAATGSRGAMGAALVGAAWMVPYTVRRTRFSTIRQPVRCRLVLGSVIALGAVLALWAVVRQPSVDEALGLTGRSALWGVALEMIVDRPVLGHGPQAWKRVVETVEPSIRAIRFPHAHSGYLELAMNYGLVGVSVVVAFFVSVFRALGKHRFGIWSAAARATWVAFAIVNVGDAFVIDARFLAIVGLVTGAAWAQRATPVTPPAPTPPPPTSSPTAPALRARRRA